MKKLLILLFSFLNLNVQAQEPSDIHVTIVDENLVPLDSITVALINRITSDTLAIELSNTQGIVEFSEVVITAEEFEPYLPKEIGLSAGYPNPFTRQVAVSARIEQVSQVVAEVYNTLGQRVLRIPQQQLTAGTHTLSLQLSSLVDGVYFVRLVRNGQVFTQQVTKVGGTSGAVLTGNWSEGGTVTPSLFKNTTLQTQSDLQLHILPDEDRFFREVIEVEVNKLDYDVSLSRVPRFSAVVRDNVTNEIIEGFDVYAIHQNAIDGEIVPIDTTWTTTGQFVDIVAQGEYVQFGMRNQRTFSYDNRKSVEELAAEENVIIAPFWHRNKQGDIIGEWTYDEMSRRHADMIRTAGGSTYGTVNQEGGTGNYSGELYVWDNEHNQPEVVLMPKWVKETSYFRDKFGNTHKDSLRG